MTTPQEVIVDLWIRLAAQYIGYVIRTVIRLTQSVLEDYSSLQVTPN